MRIARSDGAPPLGWSAEATEATPGAVAFEPPPDAQLFPAPVSPTAAPVVPDQRPQRKSAPPELTRVEVPMVLAVPAELEHFAACFRAEGHTLYVVGGAVRDQLLGRTPKDFDLATDAAPADARKILARAGAKVVDKSKGLGVSLAMIAGAAFEVASFRADTTESNGRRPAAVVQGTMIDDVLRRDLTINALYYDIASKKVIDLAGGLEDIQHRRARMIGDPDVRFREDGLRVLRFIRFHTLLGGGALDAGMERALAAHAAMPGVSAERLREELLACLRAAREPAEVLTLADRTGILARAFGGVRLNLPPPGAAPKNSAAILALLLRANDETAVDAALRKFDATRGERQAVRFLHHLLALAPEHALDLKREQRRAGVSDDTASEFLRAAGVAASLAAAYFEYTPEVRGDDARIAILPEDGRRAAIVELERRRFTAILERVRSGQIDGGHDAEERARA